MCSDQNVAEEKASKQLIIEASYLDLEDLNQSKSDEKTEDEVSPAPFTKSHLGASVLPRAKSNLWPTVLSRDQKGY